VIAFCFAKLFGTRLVFAAQIKGIEHPVYVRIPSTDVSVLKQVLIERHYEFDFDFSPRTIIDAGANIGLSAIFFANRFSDAEIVAIEPEESNYQLLVRNSAHYSNIIPMRAALWKSNGFVSLVDPGAGDHGFQTKETGIGVKNESKSIPATTVDGLMDKLGWSSLDLLKVDIEGSEKEVFDSPAPWIDHTRAIMIELHDELRSGCRDRFATATKGFRNGGRRGESVMVVNTPFCEPVGAKS
jgi:FkbM family methyltransferase